MEQIDKNNIIRNKCRKKLWNQFPFEPTICFSINDKKVNGAITIKNFARKFDFPKKVDFFLFLFCFLLYVFATTISIGVHKDVTLVIGWTKKWIENREKNNSTAEQKCFSQDSESKIFSNTSHCKKVGHYLEKMYLLSYLTNQTIS